MNIWLVSYQEEVGSTSHEYHMLLSGQDFTLAEAACERMGENWWPPDAPSALRVATGSLSGAASGSKASFCLKSMRQRRWPDCGSSMRGG